MKELINLAFKSSKRDLVKDLFFNNSSGEDRLLIRCQVARILEDNPTIIQSSGKEWILCVLSKFEKNENDTLRVFSSLCNCLRGEFNHHVLDENIKFKEVSTIADNCLVGLSFFKKRIISKHQTKSSPSVSYYRNLGIQSFCACGFERISQDFDDWVEFIETELSYNIY